MASIISLTAAPVRVTAATKQELRLAYDVSQYDELDFILTVHEGTSVVVKIITAMQVDDDTQGWVDAVTFTTISAPSSDKQNVPNLLRYVRWQVTSAGNATFSISGMGRRWASLFDPWVEMKRGEFRPESSYTFPSVPHNECTYLLNEKRRQ